MFVKIKVGSELTPITDDTLARFVFSPAVFKILPIPFIIFCRRDTSTFLSSGFGVSVIFGKVK